MLDLPVSGYTWATFAVVLLTAVISFFSNRAKRKQNYFKKVNEARREYRKALEKGDPEKIMIAKKRYYAAKTALVLLACFLTASCASNAYSTIPVGKYVQTPLEGEVVPALPEGEKRWLLISIPTGADLVLEKD